MHYDSVNKFGKLTEVLTRSAGAEAGEHTGWVFRIVHVRDGKIVGMEFHVVTFDDIDKPKK